MIRRHYLPAFAGTLLMIAALSVALVAGLVAIFHSAAAQTSRTAIPVYGYRIVHAYPHDRTAFTEGLFYLDGALYESTGLKGKSTVRKVQLDTGKVLQQKEVPSEYFGEGIVNWGSELMQLTWQSQTGFVYDRTSFATKRRFSYPGEGWALTKDSGRIIMSDGTPTLRFLNPQTLQQTGRLNVTERGSPVPQLNELEYIDGEIWANIWQTDRIARISPFTGEVASWIDLKGLLTPAERASADVLNGIAYDAATKRIFVTGKLWPKLFEIKLIPKK